MPELFTPEILAAVAALRIEARRVPSGGRHAEHHARQAGTGIEFRDYRPYAPGDDFRRIDWSLYRRFQRLFLRLSDEVRDLPLYLLVDLSDSAWLEEPPRSFAGRQAAGILAAISLNQLDPVGVFPFGAALGPYLAPLSGKRNLPRVVEFLEGQRPLGRTDFVQAFAGFRALPLRSGLVLIVSDFYDPRGIDAVVEAVRPLRHRLAFVRLVRPEDREPMLEGDLRLADCETGDTLDVTVSERARQSYRESYRAFEEALAQLAASRAAGLIEVDVTAPVLPQLAPLFQEGVYRP